MRGMKRSLQAGRAVGRPKNWNGAKLRAARERAGLSRRALSETLARALDLESVSARSVEAWEFGRCTPSSEVVRALALILRARL
jgi:transcriptional regulator with XRE-family HTH domain